MNSAAGVIDLLMWTARNGIEVETMKVIKMRSMQAEAFTVLINVLFRMINAPTGSGKSAEICFLAARELHDRCTQANHVLPNHPTRPS